MTQARTISSRDALELEAAVDLVDGARATLVVCHPHPKMGGTMNAPLLVAVRDDMTRRGWNVVRFNFRGIGSSQGESSTGTAEIEDARGALDYARTLGRPIALIGWSFGAAVALRTAAVEEDVVACVALAPPIDAKPGITEGVGETAPSSPVLVVIGANDAQVSPGRAREWAAAHGATFVEMKGANHFFWAKYDDLTAVVGGWLDERIS